MKLPKINTPKYEVKLLSVDTPVTYRPFLVKEQKILLMAAESKEKKEIMRAIVDCINNCSSVNVETLPLFDMMMLFLKIRAKSVGEQLSLRHSCDNVVEDGKVCGSEVPFRVNLDEIEYKVDPNHTNLIQITDDIGVKMKYVSLATAEKYAEIEKNPIQQMGLIFDSVDSVFTESDVVTSDEMDRSDLEEFFGSMTTSQMSLIMDFFKTQPTIEKNVSTVCPKCKHERNLNLREFDDFF